MNAARETVLAIIPAFCEARFIADVVRRVMQYVDTVLVVDDGSHDATAAESENAGANVIRHPNESWKGCCFEDRAGVRNLHWG